MKSSSAATTRAPAGRDSATRPMNVATCVPTATSAVGTPCMRAKIERAMSTDRCQP